MLYVICASPMSSSGKTVLIDGEYRITLLRLSKAWEQELIAPWQCLIRDGLSISRDLCDGPNPTSRKAFVWRSNLQEKSLRWLLSLPRSWSWGCRDNVGSGRHVVSLTVGDQSLRAEGGPYTIVWNNTLGLYEADRLGTCRLSPFQHAPQQCVRKQSSYRSDKLSS